jgi:hypothetical protein
MSEPLTDAELTSLLVRLEGAIAHTGERYKSQGTLVVVGSVVVAGLSALREIWFLVPVCLVFGAAIVFLMRGAIRNTGMSKAAPVLAALRDAPEQVRSLGHVVTSDSLGLFVTDWIEIKTANGRIFVRAEDWRVLLETLTRRCPGAKVEHSPR